MSTKDTVAGTILAELNSSASTASRASGTPTTPTFGLDRRERVVRREHVVLGQGVEQGRLADVGQADDSDGEASLNGKSGPVREPAGAGNSHEGTFVNVGQIPQCCC